MQLGFNRTKKEILLDGIPRVDRTNDLATGLFGCHIAGAWGGPTIYNIARASDHLALKSSAVYQIQPRGRGLKSTGTSTGANVVASADARVTTGVTLCWYGDRLGDALDGNGCPLYGVMYTNADTYPYWAYSITNGGTGGNPNTIECEWNSGATAYFDLAANSQATVTTGVQIIHATFLPGGSVLIYLNGVLQDTGTHGASAPSFDTNAMYEMASFNGVAARHPNAVTIMGCAWNRILRAEEIAAHALDPLAFLVYPEDDMLAMMTAADAAGQPTMLRWGGIPGMQYSGRRSW